jgi:hypothetical protein
MSQLVTIFPYLNRYHMLYLFQYFLTVTSTVTVSQSLMLLIDSDTTIWSIAIKASHLRSQYDRNRVYSTVHCMYNL